MILIHKETTEIYELRFKSFVYEPTREGGFKDNIDYSIFASYGVGEIVLVGSVNYGEINYGNFADHFEILGWL